MTLFVLTGCGTGQHGAAGDWSWTPPTKLSMGNSGASGAVIASPVQSDAGYGFVYAQDAPEFSRRDEALNVRVPDPHAGYLAFPEQQRPSLDDYRSLYLSPRSDRHIFHSEYRERSRYRQSDRRYKGRR